jgi:TonB family protein
MRRSRFCIEAGLLAGIWLNGVLVQPVQAQNQRPSPQRVFRPGTNGIGYASCLYCPAPRLPASLKQAKQTFVAMGAIIRPNGRATDIKVVKSAGSDLDQKALEAVKNWRFKPALDANGEPVPTITAITIMFDDGSGRSTKGWATGASAEYVNSVRNSGGLHSRRIEIYAKTTIFEDSRSGHRTSRRLNCDKYQFKRLPSSGTFSVQPAAKSAS